MKKSISNFVENFLLSIILDFENFPDTVCAIRIINYIRKFFVIEMLMLMTMTFSTSIFELFTKKRLVGSSVYQTEEVIFLTFFHSFLFFPKILRERELQIRRS